MLACRTRLILTTEHEMLNGFVTFCFNLEFQAYSSACFTMEQNLLKMK